MLERRLKFIAKSVTGPASAIATRAASLNHKIRNHPVKRQPIVIILLLLLSSPLVGEFFRAFGESNEIRHRFWGFLFQQSNDDVALRSFEYRVRPCGSAHEFSSRSIVHETAQD